MASQWLKNPVRQNKDLAVLSLAIILTEKKLGVTKMKIFAKRLVCSKMVYVECVEQKKR